MSEVRAVYGGGGFGPQANFKNAEEANGLLDILAKGNCHNVDTASLYGDGGSEKVLGEADAISRFTIDTKAQGGFGHGASKEKVLGDAKRSKEYLKGNVDVFYLHAPDPKVPLEESLEGVNEVYKSGFFKRFGLSNYKPSDVQKVYDICKANGYPLPQVYQGNYSAVARKQEDELIPLLRKLNMSFYAYSPIAGGFLTKSKQDILDNKGRFDPSNPFGKMYRGMYGKPSYLEALNQWEKIAEDEGCTRAELAYRWVKYNSALEGKHGDAVIFGARNIGQAEQTLASLNSGPLSKDAAKKIDQIWETIKDDAPLDNYHSGGL